MNDLILSDLIKQFEAENEIKKFNHKGEEITQHEGNEFKPVEFPKYADLTPERTKTLKKLAKADKKLGDLL